MSFLRIVHMTTVHSAIDHRIFRKECRSLARAGFDVTIIGPHPADALYEQVRICAVQPDQSRFLRMTRTVWRVYREAVRHDANIWSGNFVVVNHHDGSHAARQLHADTHGTERQRRQEHNHPAEC